MRIPILIERDGGILAAELQLTDLPAFPLLSHKRLLVILQAFLDILHQLCRHGQCSGNPVPILIEGIYLTAPRLMLFRFLIRQAEKIVPQPFGFDEVAAELTAFRLVQAFQIQLELNDRKVHRGMACLGLLDGFLYLLVLELSIRYSLWKHTRGIVFGQFIHHLKR